MGCIWALAYFWPRRRSWDWFENGSLLVLVSIFVAPFGWIFDQSLAIPAILYRRLQESLQGHPLGSRADLYRDRDSDRLTLRAALGGLSLARACVDRVVSLCARLCTRGPRHRRVCLTRISHTAQKPVPPVSRPGSPTSVLLARWGGRPAVAGVSRPPHGKRRPQICPVPHRRDGCKECRLIV